MVKEVKMLVKYSNIPASYFVLDDLLRALLLEEIDLEIGLRNRLKEIVESRLTWALALENCLERHYEPSPQVQPEKGVYSNFSDSSFVCLIS